MIAYLLEETGEAGNMIMVGDTAFDVVGAAAHGIPAIGVAWGYGKVADMEAAGAAGIACSRFYMELGVRRENICMFDSRGLIHEGRKGLNRYKKMFAQKEDLGDLAACLKGADVFLGAHQGNGAVHGSPAHTLRHGQPRA